MQAARRRADFDFTSRLGRRAEAGPRRVLPRVRPLLQFGRYLDHMGAFRTRKNDYSSRPVDGGDAVFLAKTTYDRFQQTILGLGDVRQPSTGVEAICCIFDLAGFTNFCRQVDPHLVVPDFLSRFLDWLFESVRKESIVRSANAEFDDGYALYNHLPFFAKFLGDGVLFLWDATEMDNDVAVNIGATVARIAVSYPTTFLPDVRRRVSDAPDLLRVGIARGRVFSIGNGADYVGPCINVASRLQKLIPGTTFCLARRGFDIEQHSELTKESLVVKKIAVRGVGDQELVCLLKYEYERLSVDDKKLLKDP